MHSDGLIWLLDGFTADHELATVARAFIWQVAGKFLLASAHDFAHSCDNFSNSVIVAITIAIDQTELQRLLFLKEVVHSEGRREVRIQIVLDLLSWAYFSPFIPL